jgi:hypothetical protein
MELGDAAALQPLLAPEKLRWLQEQLERQRSGTPSP